MSMSTEQAPNQPQGSPRRRTPGMVLACVAVIVVIILGGSMFWMAHSKNSAPVTNHNKTATPTAAMPTWTPTTIKPPLLSMFYDTFVNDYHGWPLGSNGGYFRILVNNALILSDTNPDTPLVESVPTITNLDNYVVSADFTINQGDTNDGMGFYLRGDSTLDHDYRVDVNGNDTFDVAKEYLDTKQSGQEAMLVPATRTDYLNPPGQLNTLTVILIGPAITVEINNIVVASFNDLSYTNGQIALFARHGSTSNGVTVSFTRFEIDRLASQFMTPVPTLTPTLTATATAGQP